MPTFVRYFVGCSVVGALGVSARMNDAVALDTIVRWVAAKPDENVRRLRQVLTDGKVLKLGGAPGERRNRCSSAANC